MNIVTELALIFGVCLAGVAIAEILPFTVPYSVISLLILTALLYRKIIRPAQISNVGGFFIRNMGIFFVPAVVGAMEYVETLRNYLVPFLVITLVTTPLVYAVTAWTVQVCMRLQKRRGGTHA
jgi:holin-like protein